MDIDAYKIFFFDTSSEMHLDLISCNGSLQSIIDSRECFVPLTRLIAEPISLVQGYRVQVIIYAENKVGLSPQSALNTIAAIVEKVPHKPPVVPSKNSASNQSKIVVDFMNLYGTSNGGSEVTNYQL